MAITLSDLPGIGLPRVIDTGGFSELPPEIRKPIVEAFRAVDQNLREVLSRIETNIVGIAAVPAATSIVGWLHDMVFSADATNPHNEIDWTSGTIELTDETTYSIVAGTTTGITAITYIYLDTAVSTTVLQVTLDPFDAIGSGNGFSRGVDIRFEPGDD